MRFLTKILVSAAVAFGLSYFMRPHIMIDSLETALVVGLVLAILNAIVKPLLVILTFPITILTLGLFLLVINGAIVLIAARLVAGFRVEGFWWAVLFSLLMSILTAILYNDDDRRART